MILFVFEGDKREPCIFATLRKLFFRESQDFIFCSYGNNLYNLYKELSNADFELDIVSLLREKFKDSPEEPISRVDFSSDISEIYLFFDFDCHNQNKDRTVDIEENYRQCSEMLEYFSDETGNGKLYINYPMVEALRYTKKVYDPDFWSYCCKLQDLVRENYSFKDEAGRFSGYGNLDFVCFRPTRLDKYDVNPPSSDKIALVKENWRKVILQNIEKANYICLKKKMIPENKEDISQQKIFHEQKYDYIDTRDLIAILSAFPLFLYEYFEAGFLLDSL